MNQENSSHHQSEDIGSSPKVPEVLTVVTSPCLSSCCQSSSQEPVWPAGTCSWLSQFSDFSRPVNLWWTNILLWKDPPFFMGKSTISMASFSSFLYVHQRVCVNFGQLVQMAASTWAKWDIPWKLVWNLGVDIAKMPKVLSTCRFPMDMVDSGGLTI